MSTKVMTGLISAAAGAACLVAAVQQGLAYNEVDDPGALNAMVDLGIASLACFLVPAVLIAAWVIREMRREIARLGLTPMQVAIAETAVFAVAHHEWSEHNRDVSAALTESVMGPERSGEPWV